MTLDVLSKAGQETVRDEALAASLWESHNAGWSYASTPKAKASAVDAVLVQNGSLVGAIVETKCRYDLGYSKFFGVFRGQWLMTLAKVTKCAEVSRLLCVPFYGFLYLPEEDILLTQRITDSTGTIIVPYTTSLTETQAGVNGGTARRENAFIDMSSAKVLRRIS